MDTAHNEHDPSQDYIQGFNEGYTLTKYMPELAEQLVRSLGDDDRAEGFKNGKGQIEYEMTMDSRPLYAKRYDKEEKGKVDPTLDKGNLEIDRDDVEPEID